MIPVIPPELVRLRLASRAAKIFQNFLYFCHERVREVSLSQSSVRFTVIRGFNTMSKLTLTGFILPLLLLFTSFEASSRNPATKNSPGNQLQLARRSLDEGGSGTLQKMIVQNGSVTMELDLNRLNGISSVAARPVTLHFAVAANSFFTILVFNDLLRGPEPSSIALSPKVQDVSGLPIALAGSFRQLVIKKL